MLFSLIKSFLSHIFGSTPKVQGEKEALKDMAESSVRQYKKTFDDLARYDRREKVFN